MKKLFTILLAVLLVFGLTACNNGGGNEPETVDDKHLENLSIAFVPSKPADAILEAAEPLKQMLIDKLAEKGYNGSASGYPGKQDMQAAVFI